MFKINFSSINADQMQPFRYTSMFDVKPWQDLDLSIVKHFKTDIKLYDRCIQKFEALSKNTIHDFDILDILALLVIRHDGWNTPISKTVAQHWWLSVINQHDKDQELLTMLNFLLQYEYGDISQHFGNVVALDHLKQTLIQGKNHHWQDDILKTVTLSILKNDAEHLAQFALKDQKLSIRELSHHYPFTIPDDLKQRAGVFWLNAYLKLSEQKLIEYSSTIQVWLNEQTDIDFAVSRAWSIFDNPYFSKDLVQLENQTHKFGDIFTWLKQWANQPNFRTKLGTKYSQILNTWLGAGNYYQLEQAIRKISEIYNGHTEKQGSNISLNRYFFWTNYQAYIEDYYLLIPKNHIYLTKIFSESENIILMDSSKFTDDLPPIIILRFKQYAFIQPLILRAANCELTMIKDINQLNSLIEKDTIFVEQLMSIEPCLIHDFCYGWQHELIHILKTNFNITTAHNVIKISEILELAINRDLSDKETSDRKKQLKKWYNISLNHALPLRHDRVIIKKYAQNVEKNNLNHAEFLVSAPIK